MGVLRTPLKLTGTPTPDRVRGRLFILSHQGGGDRIPTSRIARVIVAAFLSVIAVGIETHAHAEKIRTAIPQANLNYLSIYVADGRGYFKDEGLENETVVISGPLATAALLSGDVISAAAAAAVCALPSKARRSYRPLRESRTFSNTTLKSRLASKRTFHPSDCCNCSWSKEVKEESEAAQRRTK